MILTGVPARTHLAMQCCSSGLNRPGRVSISLNKTQLGGGLGGVWGVGWVFFFFFFFSFFFFLFFFFFFFVLLFFCYGFSLLLAKRAIEDTPSGPKALAYSFQSAVCDRAPGAVQDSAVW